MQPHSAPYDHGHTMPAHPPDLSFGDPRPMLAPQLGLAVGDCPPMPSPSPGLAFGDFLPMASPPPGIAFGDFPSVPVTLPDCPAFGDFLPWEMHALSTLPMGCPSPVYMVTQSPHFVQHRQPRFPTYMMGSAGLPRPPLVRTSHILLYLLQRHIKNQADSYLQR